MTGKRRSGSWQRRLLGVVLAIVLVLLAWLAFDTYHSYRETATELVLESNREAAFLSAIRLRDELTKFSDDLAAIARTKDMSLGLATRQKGALGANAARLALFDGGVVLLDGFGKVRAAEPPRPELLGADWSNHDLFTALLTSTNPQFTSVAGFGSSGANVVVVSVPITGDNGELMGVLAGLFQLDQSASNAFYASVIRLRIRATGNTYIVDNIGRILFDSAFERLGQFIPLPADATADARGDALLTTDPDGNRIILAYAPIPGTSWSLLVENDWSIEGRPIRRYAGGLAALLTIGLMLPALGFVVLLRNRRTTAFAEELEAEEARLAALMRSRLLPPQPPLLSGYELAVRTLEPTKGSTPVDFHDLMLLRDGRLALTLSSVNKQGLLATHIMALTRAGLRAAAYKNIPPAEALGQCNLLLCPEVEADSGVASTYALLDPQTDQLQFAAAGQPPPLRWDGAELNQAPLTAQDRLLGQELDAQFVQDAFFIAPGVAVIFYSRGLAALTSAAGDPFTIDRLALALHAPLGDAENLADMLIEALHAFIEDSQPTADVTLLVLRREPAPVNIDAPRRRTPHPKYATLAETDTDL